MTVELMAAHVARVCKVEDIIVERHSTGGRAYRTLRKIKIRPIKSDITYCIALHEIGHILGPRQCGKRIDKETGAWEWARANAIRWTPRMTATMRTCLMSYVNKINRSPRMTRPDDDHPVHALLKE